ncbi:response regulator transcription factor [Paenibacillus sp. JCM 10914]|uniref:response regulator transcription factor n=1 Tax=Paenibacillus sp. JCM 10914 TaxID=1236974 RepID=UPI0003CCB228|nr:response regulator transcription factor [Paenibacillus sp. JCM 10914]GAE06985.1 fructose response regulator of fruA and EII fructose/mannose [Paenibacillus sp. JCM 10914]
MTINVIIADDNAFVREGLKIILTSFQEFEVLAAVHNGEEAVAYCNQHSVDVALLDIQMPVMSGVEAAKRITESTQTKSLILTTFDDEAIIVDAIKNGAKGYLLKNNDPERIRDAIIAVYNGHNVLQETVFEKLKTGWVPEKNVNEIQESKIDRSLFTNRELDIMSLISKGLSNREISKELFLSEGTVANHITSILGKTALDHRTQIAIYYLTGKGR